MENASPAPYVTGSSFSPVRRFSQIVLVVSLLLALSLNAEALRRERIVDTWRPVHYSVNIRFNDSLSEITEARAEIKAEALKNISQIDLDFGDLNIDSVVVNYQVVKYERRAGTLRIKLAESQPRESHFSIIVVYHGRPQDGLILTNDKDGKPSAVGDNWPDRVHNW